MSTRSRSLACVVLLICCGAGSAAAASGPASPGSLPVSAASVAARVDHHYNAIRSLRVNFVQQYDGMGMHRRESGILLLSKPGRMRWTYADPAGKLFVLDGRDAWFYSPGETEVQRVPANKLDDLRSPLRFLLGHTQIAKELSGLTISSPTAAALGNQTAGAVYDLSGVPKGMEQRVAALRLTVTAQGVILGIRIEETDGAVTTFSFSGEQTNVPTTNTDFVFTAPPGVEMVTGLPPV
jgi:outer membrane lipoprotein carrier protein